jgi:hypothetical protein
MNGVTLRQTGAMKAMTRSETGRRHGKGTAFAAACAASCQKVVDQVARVRESLFAEWREILATEERVLRLTLNEAEALAWQTELPHLVFPALAEEKVRAVVRWNRRQQLLNLGRRVVATAWKGQSGS